MICIKHGTGLDVVFCPYCKIADKEAEVERAVKEIKRIELLAADTMKKYLERAEKAIAERDAWGRTHQQDVEKLEKAEARAKAVVEALEIDESAVNLEEGQLSLIVKAVVEQAKRVKELEKALQGYDGEVKRAENLTVELGALNAQNQRLREALEKIRTSTDIAFFIKIAEQALNESKTTL